MKRSAGIVVLCALAIVAAVASYAFWSGSAAGSATGAAGSALSMTITPGTPSAELAPGGTAGVAATISNPNLFGVRITQLSLDSGAGTGGFAVDAAHPGCVTTALSYIKQTNGGAGWTVPAKVGAVNGSLPVTLSAALAMSDAAPDACQGAGFTVFLVAG